MLADLDRDCRTDILSRNYWIRCPEEFDLPWCLFAIRTWAEKKLSAPGYPGCRTGRGRPTDRGVIAAYAMDVNGEPVEPQTGLGRRRENHDGRSMVVASRAVPSTAPDA